MEKQVIGKCTLYRADCADVLPTLGSMDVLVSDPPYGIDYAHSGFAATRGSFRASNGTKFAHEKIAGDDSEFDPALILRAAPIAFLFGANHYARHLPSSPGDLWIYWDKGVHEGLTFSSGELCWSNKKGALRSIRHVWCGATRQGVCNKTEKRSHPTEKPVRVMDFVLSFSEGSVIDPYMGSGSTGVACVNASRPFVGVEVSTKYFDAACARIENAQRQGALIPPTTYAPEQAAIALA